MLQKLSYFNLIFAIIYLLVYLKSGTFNSAAGIFAIIVSSWLALRSYQLENYAWRFWHYIAAGWSIYYIGTLIYGSYFIFKSVIEFGFVSSDTTTYLVMSFLLTMMVTVHSIIYFRCNLKAKKSKF